jgi:hypothetical protein
MSKAILQEGTEVRRRHFKRLIHGGPNNRCKSLRAYVKKVFGRKLERNQFKALRDMLDPKVRKIYYSTARQAGKTETIAIFQAIASMFPEFVIPQYEGRANCYVFAPKQEQAQISFERYANIIRNNSAEMFPQEDFITDKADRIRVKNGFEVRAITASRNAEIEGLTTHIIILDESQAISPYKVRESIFPMGGGVPGGAKIIQCGLPGLLGSHFHKAYKNKYHPVDNPHGYVHHVYPWRECPRVQEDYIMTLKSEDDQSFARNYELSWDKNGFGYFVDETQYENCELDYDPISLRKKAIDYGWEFHWGLDFAKLRDSTVLTEIVIDPETSTKYIVRLIELPGVDYIQQVAYFADMYNPSQIVHVMADQTCVGEVIVELMNDKGIRTTGIVFTTKSKDGMYKNLRKDIQQQNIRWPIKPKGEVWKKFKQQMLELEVEFRLNGQMSVHHNLDDNLARDDYPDSLALCCWSPDHYIPPQIGFLGD